MPLYDPLMPMYDLSLLMLMYDPLTLMIDLNIFSNQSLPLEGERNARRARARARKKKTGNIGG